MKTHFFVVPFLLLMVFVAFSDWLGICLNVTPSMELGVYRKLEKQPARGDIVGFCLTGEAMNMAKERGYLKPGSCPSGLRPMLKILAGLPGDTITVHENGLIVELPDDTGTCWPTPARGKDSMGRPMFSALHNGKIPPDMALVLTTHAGSFDSRYFGFVPLSSLTAYEQLFTF